MPLADSLSPRRQRLLLGAVVSGLFLAMLDQTIVGTALPRIVTDLGGADLYVWVVTAYLVPATVTVPVYARLSDRYGRRALLLCGMVLFVAGSALSASARDMTQLILERALQGAGAGALEGLSFILIADLFAGRRSAALQGIMAGLMGISFLAGPLIGGFVVDHFDWRWVFLVNVPIGLVALVVVASVLPGWIGRSEERGAPLDVAGIAALTIALGVVLVGLSERTHPAAGGHLPGWAEPRTGGLVVLGVLLLAGFLWIERRAPAPIVPPRLFADRRTAAILAAATTAMFGLPACVLLLPRYFQVVRDVSATHSGLLVYPLMLGVLVSVNVGAIIVVRRLEFRRPLLAGLAVVALGGLGFATFGASTPDWQSLIFMALIGLGIGPTLSGLQIAMQRTVVPAALGGAMGTLILLRQVGASIALATAETVYGAGSHGGGMADAATATGTGVAVVTLVGALLAAAAIGLLLPRGAARLPPLPA